ncbi:Uncharacterised protein [Neisseria gonorrhoeae]|uniref:Uncharacterized protein n=1 Tax=Neisseria gonorrhoeae TaxID=485 RepID=A0A378W0M6_NEIGO|nr:Uncharacterised protein [Neisseria gonorrhoeae]
MPSETAFRRHRQQTLFNLQNMFRSREGFGFDFGNIRPNRSLDAALPAHKVFDEFRRLPGKIPSISCITKT